MKFDITSKVIDFRPYNLTIGNEQNRSFQLNNISICENVLPFDLTLINTYDSIVSVFIPFIFIISISIFIIVRFYNSKKKVFDKLASYSTITWIEVEIEKEKK
jgi:hypothetical protein